MDLSDLEEAYAADDSPIPAIWTPSWVQTRLIEAFDVLLRSPMNIGPAKVGNGLPQIIRDFAELIDQTKLEEAERTGQNRTVQNLLELMDAETQKIVREDLDAKVRRESKMPTSGETSRSEEALGWWLRFVGEAQPLAGDALHTWVLSKAGGFKIAPLLRLRVLAADAMIAETQKRVRREVARKWLAWAKDQKGARDYPEVVEEARRQVAWEFALIGRRGSPWRVDVMPGKIFTAQRLDYHRKKGAALLAKALRRAGVGVR